MNMNEGADSRFASRQWETSLQSNVVFIWLGANLESALNDTIQITLIHLEKGS